ncbi:hypothetical protein BDW67DRAFT_152269 [Aspergillus spinulosporus]
MTLPETCRSLAPRIRSQSTGRHSTSRSTSVRSLPPCRLSYLYGTRAPRRDSGCAMSSSPRRIPEFRYKVAKSSLALGMGSSSSCCCSIERRGARRIKCCCTNTSVLPHTVNAAEAPFIMHLLPYGMQRALELHI